MRAIKAKQIRRAAVRFALMNKENEIPIKLMARNARKKYSRLKSPQAKIHFMELMERAWQGQENDSTATP